MTQLLAHKIIMRISRAIEPFRRLRVTYAPVRRI